MQIQIPIGDLVPQRDELILPTLRAITQMSGVSMDPVHVRTIDARIVEEREIRDEVVNYKTSERGEPRLKSNLRGARTWLRNEDWIQREGNRYWRLKHKKLRMIKNRLDWEIAVQVPIRGRVPLPGRLMRQTLEAIIQLSGGSMDPVRHEDIDAWVVAACKIPVDVANYITPSGKEPLIKSRFYQARELLRGDGWIQWSRIPGKIEGHSCLTSKTIQNVS